MRSNISRGGGRRFIVGAASLIALVAVAETSHAGPGFWQRESAIFHGVDDKPCRQPASPCTAGYSKSDPGPPIDVQVYEASQTHVTFGKRIPNRSLQPHWSRIKVWWQAPSAVLRPGEKFTLDHGVEVQVPGWANFDSKSWIYRMSGPGGEADQLGSIVVSDASAGLAKSTKQHTVPQGFGAGTGNEARLRYQIGATNGSYGAGKVVYSYKWIPDGAAPPVATAPDSPKADGSVSAPAGTSGASSAGSPPSSTIHGTNPREQQGDGGRDSRSDAASGATPAEVEVRNLALGRPTRQSSTYSGTGVDQGPQHAVDGKTSGRDPHDLIHTNYESKPWWQVDLGGAARIEKLRLFNRTNPQLKTCLALVVDASDDGHAWRRVYTHDGKPWKVLDLPAQTTGRFVRVALTNHDGLQLYEVEVWGSIPRMVR